MLDFILRHQSLLGIALSVLGLLPLVGAFIREHELLDRHVVLANVRRTDSEQHPGQGRWFWWILICIISGGVAFAVFRPVSKTAALEFPAPFRETQGNHRLILFIHGWRGDVRDSWKEFPNLVIKDPRFAACDILSLSYPTYIDKRSLTVPQLSQWLTEQMRQRGYYRRYDRICIIAHSLGGLVAREIIIENRLGSISDGVQKLVEIATPHSGANIAALASALGLDRAYVKDVEPNSRYLGDLRDKWNHLNPRPATFAITSITDRIVTPASAEEQCDRYQIFPQWSHVELAKPDSQQDDRYAFAMEQILSAIN